MDNLGNKAPSGVYFYELKAEITSKSEKDDFIEIEISFTFFKKGLALSGLFFVFYCSYKGIYFSKMKNFKFITFYIIFLIISCEDTNQNDENKNEIIDDSPPYHA